MPARVLALGSALAPTVVRELTVVREQRRAGGLPLRLPLHRQRSSEQVPGQVAVWAWELALALAQQQVQLPEVSALAPQRPASLVRALRQPELPQPVRQRRGPHQVHRPQVRQRQVHRPQVQRPQVQRPQVQRPQVHQRHPRL